MNIDFTMTGLSLSLICGILLILQGVCFLIMQNPFKKIKKFGVRDYIILAVIACFIVVGIVLTVLGIVSAAPMLS